MSVDIECLDWLWGEQGLVRWMVEQLPDAVYVSNLDTGELIYYSGAAEAVTGFAPEELIAMRVEGVRARIHPDDQPRNLECIRHLLERGGRETVEFRWLHQDGSYRWLSNSRSLLPTDQNAPKLLVGTLRDVTAQKRTEQALATELNTAQRLQQVSTQLIQANEREALYQQILDTSMAILHADFASIQMFHPERGPKGELQLLGCRGFSEQAAGFWEWVSPASQSPCGMALRTGQRVIVPDTLTCDWMAGSGDQETCLQTGIRAIQTTPLISRSGVLLGVISTHWRDPYEPTDSELGTLDILARQAADILERKQAEEALRESERRARVLLDSVPTTFFLMTPDGTLLDLNTEAARKLQVQYEEAVGQNVYALLPPKAAARRRAWAEEMLRTRQPVRHRDERGGWVLDHRAHPVLDEDGRVTAIAVYAEDITNRVQTEKERERLLAEVQRRAAELDASLGAIRDGLLILGPDDKIVRMNHAAERLAGVTTEQWMRVPPVRGSEIIRAETVDGRPLTLEETPRYRAEHGEEVVGFHMALRHPDESRRIVHTSAGPIRDKKGHVTGVIVNWSDVTSEVALREQVETERARLEAVLDALPVGVFLADPSGRLVLTNQAATDVWGHAPLSKSPDEYSDDYQARWPDTGQRVQPHEWPLARAVKCGEVSGAKEIEIETTEGQRKTVLNYARPVRDGMGTIIGGVEVDVDITERRRADQALRKSERRARVLLDSVPDTFFLMTPDGTLLDLNTELARRLGLRREDMIGQNIYALLPPDVAARRRAWSEEVLRTRQSLHDQDERDGHVLDHRLHPVLNDDGRVMAVAVYAEDVTDRVRADEEIRRQNAALQAARAETETERQRLEAMMQALPVGMAFCDAQGGLVRSNRAYDMLWGENLPAAESVEDYVAYRAWWVDTGQLVAPEEWASARAVQKGETVVGQFLEIQRFDGTRAFVLNSAAPVRDASGQIVGSAVAIQDITELQQAQQALRDLKDTLEQRVAERTVQLRALAAELSRAEEGERKRVARILHDHLQQLLVAARLNVNSLARRLAEPPLHRVAENIDQVLDEAIRTSRSLTAELSPPVLYDAGLTAGLHWLARWFEEKYSLRVDVQADELGNTTPEVTRAVLFQAARELLFNVVKHSGANRARVELRRLPNDDLELMVRDQGAGFEPTQIGPSADGGFGLFHLTERLEMLGGRMEVESAPGQGTCVCLQVPQHQAGVDHVAAEDAASRLIRRESAPSVELATADRLPVRVLLVDDHTIMRQGLAHLLADEAGIQLVGQASDGREALELAHTTRPDVVLMDVSMPVMDGIEATCRLTDELPDIKVIGLSMYADPEVSQRMREAGAVEHIPKGGDPAALIKAVRRWGKQ